LVALPSQRNQRTFSLVAAGLPFSFSVISYAKSDVDGTCLKTFEGHTSSILRASFLSRGAQFVLVEEGLT